MPQLFISYSRVDTETTERLVERLRRVYGLPNVWYDDELHGGMRWWQAILNQIAQCDVFIYLLSNESVTSPYCQAEFTEAKRLQKPIVTVQIRDRTRLSDDLSEIQYVDMKRGLNDDTLARLIRAINEQAQVPKKKRALWRPITPLPNLPSSEEASSVARIDVETPTLEVQALPTSIGDRTVARATILGAVITGGLGLAAVVVSAVLPSLINPTPPIVPSHPATSDSTAAVIIPTVTIQSQTTIPPTFTLALTDNPQPSTEHSTDTQTPTPIPMQTDDATSTETFTSTRTATLTQQIGGSLIEALARGELRVAFMPTQFYPQCIRSNDANYLSVPSEGVYRLSDMQQLFPLLGYNAVFSPDSAYAAIGGNGVYRLADGQWLFALSGYNPVFSQDSNYVVTNQDGVYRILDGRQVIASSGTFSPDGAYVAVSRDGVYRLADGQQLLTLPNNSSTVFSPDSAYVSVSEDGVYRLADGQRLFALLGYNPVFSLDSNYVGVSQDGVYRLADGEQLITSSSRSSPVFSPNSDYVSIGGDGVYQLTDGQRLFALSGYNPVFSLDSNYMATSQDGVYRLADGEQLITSSSSSNLVFSPNSDYVSIGGDGVYQLTDGQRLFALSGYNPVFSLDSNYMATSQDGVYRLADGEQLITSPSRSSPVFSPNSDYVSIGGDGVYRLADGEKIVPVAISQWGELDNVALIVGCVVFRYDKGQEVFYLTTVYPANLRDEPNINAFVRQSVSTGATFIAVDRSPDNEWYRVNPSGLWVSATVVEVRSPSDLSQQ